MTAAELVAPHLPYLRRYARALTGTRPAATPMWSRRSRRCWPTFRPSTRPSDAKVALFRTFSKIWNSLSVNTTADTASASRGEARLRAADAAAAPGVPADARSRASPRTRAPRSSGSTDPTFRDLIDDAGREIAEQIATDVLIIEDEPLIALDLEALVEDRSATACVDVARTRNGGGRAGVARSRPGLVLADIQLADGSSGIDAVNDILAHVRRAGDLHHRLPGALADRRAAGADLPDHQAVPAGDGEGGDQPGAVLRAQRPAAPPRGGVKRGQPRRRLRRRQTSWHMFSSAGEGGRRSAGHAGALEPRG